MADKRMLAKTIIESDPFCDMPCEAQMLYVRLNLAADDDGFVSNPRTIMRSFGASEDAMKLLIAKKFVLSFQKGDDFIFLIKHWKIHNTIRGDRYKASAFKELLREVYLDENKAYSMTPGENKTPALPNRQPSDNQVSTNRQPSDNQVSTNRQPSDNQMETQNRLDKDSIDKNRLDIDKGSIEKGEYEGGTVPPAAVYSDPEKKKERIDWFIERIKFLEQSNFTTSGMYALAAGEGISKAEIELRRLQLEKQATK